MNLQERIDLLIKLGQYLQTGSPEWTASKERAERQNGWFTQVFIDRAVEQIATQYLAAGKLRAFAAAYSIPMQPAAASQAVGLVMAGNIPLVGFHDWLCVFLSGQQSVIKPSSKDTVLITHLIEKLTEWNGAVAGYTRFAEMLKGCDAYIATGSNNSARYFTYYFSKYPNIIRRNRTSVAVLTGHETQAELEALSDDVNLYFGLGCRNITKIYVPAGYDFIPLLAAFEKYAWFADHHKYRNNYDYQLAILLLNNQFYMTNGSVLLVENPAFFSAISQLHYEYYTQPPAEIIAALQNNPQLQCVIHREGGPGYGQAQHPTLTDFADGVDTMAFLRSVASREAVGSPRPGPPAND